MQKRADQENMDMDMNMKRCGDGDGDAEDSVTSDTPIGCRAGILRNRSDRAQATLTRADG